MITIQAGYALVIDDEPSNRDFLERLLQTASFKVMGASNGAEGLKAAKSVPELALALVDQQLPDSTGLEIIAKLRADNPETLLIMATMHDDRTLIDEAFVKGADVFLVKPHGFMELYRRLKEVDTNIGLLRRLVIDQYGPRPYKGTGQLKMQTNPPVTLGPGATRPHRPTGPLPPLPASKPPSGSGGTQPAASPAQPATSSERKGSEETVARRPSPGLAKPDAKPAS
jgi:CheY-like chemotaxis protein